MPTLILIRHGATQWAEQNRFAGWADTVLSEGGREQARAAAKGLRNSAPGIDLCFASRLTRARETAEVIMTALGLPQDRLCEDWRLNERHYGALQGELRGDMIRRHGNAQIVEWRRGYDARPPQLPEDDPRWHEQLARLADIPAEKHPRAESLGEAVARVTPVWDDSIAPALRKGACVLVVAHTSAIRGLVRRLENLDDAQSAAFRISTAVPRRYELGDALDVVHREDMPVGAQARLRHWFTRLKPRNLGRI